MTDDTDITFRAEKRSAQASAHPLSQAQGGLFCVLSVGAYHLTENFGNSGWEVNGKVTFRKFQPKIEEYVLR